MSLFRKEVLDAQRNGWLGGISLVQPPSVWGLTLAAAAIAVCIALFLVLGSYTRHNRVTGQLVPTEGLSTVMAPATGVVDRMAFVEGDRVAAGQVLAVVRVPRATIADGDTAEALRTQLRHRRESLWQADAAQTQQWVAQRQGLRAQLAAAQGELTQIEREIATGRSQVRIAEETLARLEQLRDGRYVSLLQIKQQESAGLAYRSEVQALQRQALAARRSFVQLRQSLDELPARHAGLRADYRRDLAALEEEQVRLKADAALAIVAPVAGVITAQIAKPGQAVQLGQPLLSVLPGDGTLEAELLVPSRAIGFIAPGNPVLLRYQAYPYQKFGHAPGRVTHISRSALSPGELGVLTGKTEAGEPFYRVTVALTRQAVTAYGRAERLRPGMLLDADVLGERRRLIEWAFEPLYSLKGRLANG